MTAVDEEGHRAGGATLAAVLTSWADAMKTKDDWSTGGPVALTPGGPVGGAKRI